MCHLSLRSQRLKMRINKINYKTKTDVFIINIFYNPSLQDGLKKKLKKIYTKYLSP